MFYSIDNNELITYHQLFNSKNDGEEKTVLVSY